MLQTKIIFAYLLGIVMWNWFCSHVAGGKPAAIKTENLGKTPKLVSQIALYVIWLLCAIRQVKKTSLATIKQVKKSVGAQLHVPPSSQLYLLLPHGILSGLREGQGTEEFFRLYQSLNDVS